MRCIVNSARGFVVGALWMAAPTFSAELMSPAQQTALVQKYCAVCHTDAVKNGGLTLQHYDAAQFNPALAAMLLSKLRSGAMGAAGLGIPDAATQRAWVAAAEAQAKDAKNWTVIHGAPETPMVTASVVREVVLRGLKADTARLYRLTLACNPATREGQMQLTWSPQPQTDRAFSVSEDGHAGVSHELVGREEKMGNGLALTAGLAAAKLNVSMPEKSLKVADLFPGETVVFPVGDLDGTARNELRVCFPQRTTAVYSH